MPSTRAASESSAAPMTCAWIPQTSRTTSASFFPGTGWSRWLRASLPRMSSLVSAFVEGFEVLAELFHELRGVGAVDQPVVVGEAEVHHRPDRDHVLAALVRDDDGPLDQRLDVEDRHLRLADDRRADDRAPAAWVRDRERAALDVVRRQLLVPRALGDIGDPACQPEQVQTLRVLDHRDDQAVSALERDRDSEVDVVLDHHLLAADLGVDPRPVLDRLDRRAGDEGEVRGGDAVALLVLRFEALSDRDDLREVDLEDRRNVRRGVERAAHVLGDPAAHRVYRLDLLARGRCDRLRLWSGCRRLRRRGRGGRGRPRGGGGGPRGWRGGGGLGPGGLGPPRPGRG